MTGKVVWMGALALAGLLSAPPSAEAQSNDAMSKRGKMLWVNRGCDGCHAIGRRMAGPDLAGIEQRRPPEWIRRWLKETDVMLASDSVAMALKAEWSGISMPNQGLSDRDIDAILSYIRGEEAKRNR